MSAVGRRLAGVLVACAVFAPAAFAGTVTLEIVDRLGRAEMVPFRVRGADGTEIAASAATGGAVAVASGRWTVEAADDPAASAAVDVAGDGAVVARVAAGDAVWLTIADDGTEDRFLFRPKGHAGLLAAMARQRLGTPGDDYFLASRRPGSTAGQRDRALMLARAEVARAPLAATAPQDERARRLVARTWARRVIAAWGEAGDADRLATVPDVVDHDWLHVQSVVARIEARLGTIATGHLRAQLRHLSADVAANAARILHGYGVAGAADALADLLARPVAAADLRRDPWAFAYLSDEGAYAVLLDLPPALARPAMEQAAARFAARAAEIAALPEAERRAAYNPDHAVRVPLLAFFLAHGGDDALRRLAGTPLTLRMMRAMALFTDDLRDIARIALAADGTATAPSEAVSSLCPALALMEPAAAAAQWRDLGEIVYAAALARPWGTQARPEAYASFARDYLDLTATRCWPSAETARAYAERNLGRLPWQPWIAVHWQDDGVLDRTLADPDSLTQPILVQQWFLMTPGRLEAQFARGGGRLDADPYDLFVAALRVLARDDGIDPFDRNFELSAIIRDPVLRRPYLFGGRDATDEMYGVGLSGILTVEPALVETTLRLPVRLEQAAHYGGGGTLIDFRQGDRRAWGHHKYVEGRGRALIADLRVRRGDAALPVAGRGLASDGALVFEADLGTADLAGVTVEIDLDFFDQRRRLVLDLYAEETGRRARVARDMAEQASLALAAAGADGAAILSAARAQGAAGRLDAAAGLFRRAAGRPGTDAGPLSEAAGLYLAAGRSDPAVALYREAAARGDGSAAASAAVTLYRAGRYAEAADAFAALARGGDGEAWRFWSGIARLLAGDAAGADAALAAVGEASRATAVLLLRHRIAREAAGADRPALVARLAATESTDRMLLRALARDIDRNELLRWATPLRRACEARFWLADAARLDRAAETRVLLGEAIDACPVDSYWHRLARDALERMPPG